MENLAKSLATLVKFNDGLFKSQKQADFILSKLYQGQCWVFHKAYNNSSKTVYDCDCQGITRVTKINTVKGEEVFTIIWDRSDASYAEAQQAKLDKKAAKAKLEAEKREGEQAHFQRYIAECNRYNKAIKNFGAILAAKLVAEDEDNLLSTKAVVEYLKNKTAYELAEHTTAKKLIAREKRIDEKLKLKFYP